MSFLIATNIIQLFGSGGDYHAEAKLSYVNNGDRTFTVTIEGIRAYCKYGWNFSSAISTWWDTKYNGWTASTYSGTIGSSGSNTYTGWLPSNGYHSVNISKTFNYNDNRFDLNTSNLELITPDYAAGISITVTTGFSTAYTAPANGYLSIFLASKPANSLSGTGHVYVNGNVALACNPTAGDQTGNLTGQIMVEKGDVVTSDNIYNESSNQAYFYPMKGV